MWRVQCKLPDRVADALDAGAPPPGVPTKKKPSAAPADRISPPPLSPLTPPPPRRSSPHAGGALAPARGGIDVECSACWITRDARVHAWSLPLHVDEREGGSPSDYFEYAIPPRVVGADAEPLVRVAHGDGGATLWVVAVGATTGVVTVARRDAAGTAEEMGTATLPDLPATAEEGGGGSRDDGAPRRPVAVALAAAPASRRGVLAVVGCEGGELFLVECAHRGAVSVVPARRERGSGAGDSPGVLSGVLSATKAFGLSFLRDDAAEKEPSRARRRPYGAIKSLSWSPSPDGGRARLLALTETSIEEWDVDDGEASLARAHAVVGAARDALGVRGDALELVSAAHAPGREEPGAVVVLAREGADRWSLLLCARPPGEASAVVASSSGALPPGAVPAATRRGARGRDDACVHAGGIPADAALVTTSGGGAAIFAGEGMRDQLLLHDPAAGGGRVLAARAAPGTGGWLLLTALMGVVAYAPSPSGAAPGSGVASVESPRAFPAAPKPGREPAEAAEEPAPAPSDPAAAAEAVRAEFSSHERGDAARGPPAETSFRLRAAGALAGDASGAPFAACSRAIVDALPKHWPGKGGPGPATETQLEDKTRRHDAFTRWLADATGVWSVLPAGEREQILEHGELVAALLCVRYLHNEAALAEEEAEAEGALAEDEPAGVAAALLREIAATAGAALQGSDAAVRGRPAAEVCYSRATGAAAALLPALADATARRAGGGVDASFAERAAALDALSRAALGALGAAAEFRRNHAMLYPAVHAGAVAPPPRWFAGPSARAALFAAATAAAALRAEAARSGDVYAAASIGDRLLALTVPLLDACAAELVSFEPGSGARAVAREEYVRARAATLPALLDAARDEAAAAAEASESGEAFGDERPAGVTADAVAAVAEAHFGYEQLAELCEAEAFEAAQRRDERAAATAARRMHHYMRSLRGAPADGEGTFARFAFERMMTTAGASYHGGVGPRVAEMLRHTPDEFYDELTSCLESRPELLWTHQLRAEDFAASAQTLKNLSGGAGGPGGTATVASRRRFLSLAKLASLADGVTSSSDEIIEMDAALDLLAIQSRIAARRGADCDRDPPATPLGLIEACLEGEGAGAPGREDDVLDAFAAFASAGDQFRRKNRSKLEACWRLTAAETDWEQLATLRERGGDDAFVRALGETAVARAARRCYDDAFAVRLGAPFSEVLTIEDVLKLLEDALGTSENAALREALGVGVGAASGGGGDERMEG